MPNGIDYMVSAKAEKRLQLLAILSSIWHYTTNQAIKNAHYQVSGTIPPNQVIKNA
ncbi:hypothetical protein ACE6H2_007468 [Prunus campanulata]